jgi:hypothetical protein
MDRFAGLGGILLLDILARRATYSQRAMSDLMASANSCEVLPTGSTPMVLKRSLTSGFFTIAVSTSCSFLTIVSGVPVGATMPTSVATSVPGNPASATVGTSGNSELRCVSV